MTEVTLYLIMKNLFSDFALVTIVFFIILCLIKIFRNSAFILRNSLNKLEESSLIDLFVSSAKIVIYSRLVIIASYFIREIIMKLY